MNDWTVRRFAGTPKYCEVPAGTRVKTRSGHTLLRMPRICNVHGVFFFDKAIFDNVRKNMAHRAEEMIEQAIYQDFGIGDSRELGALTYEKFKANMAALGIKV